MTAKNELPYSRLLSRARQNLGESRKLLGELISYPTVAPRDKKGLKGCADALESQFESYGFKVMQWGNPPVVYAERHVGAKKTLMCYHHYDVQTEGDIGLWKSSPWKMAVREQRMFGRGAIDDKGPCVASLVGLKVIEDALGKLPVNAKFIVEGEEEWTSEALTDFAKKHKALLRADGCIWEGISATPGSITEVYPGMKGDIDIVMTVGGPPEFPKFDAHSGSAGVIQSAPWRLTSALNSLMDGEYNITIDGLDELVRKPSKDDIDALLKSEGDIVEKMGENYGFKRTVKNRRGLEALKALYLEPSLSINGLESGCQGVVHSTIIPAKAIAKLDLRLVPDMRSDKVMRLLRAHLDRRGFTDVVLKGNGYEAAKTPVSDPFVQLVYRTAKEVAAPAKTTIIPMMSGTGPAHLFVDHTPICLSGSYADQDKVYEHGPNENIPIASMINSIAFVAKIAERLG